MNTPQAPLSVEGPRDNSRSPVAQGSLLSLFPPWPPSASDRSRGQGGAPGAERGRTTLTPGRTGAGWWAAAGTHPSGITSRRTAGWSGARWRPALSRSTSPGLGDMMVDWVTPGRGAAAQSFWVVQPGGLTAGGLREQAAGHLVFLGQGAHRIHRSGGLGQGEGRRRRQGLLAHAEQDVVGPARDAAGL